MNPGKMTPHIEARIAKLSAKGLSHRKIADQLATEGTPVSRTTVGNVLHDLAEREKRAREAAERGEGEEPVRGRAGAGARGGERRGGRESQDEGGDVEAEMPELPEDASVAARVVYQELVDVRSAARQVHAKVLAGEFPMNQWVSAKAHALRLMKALAELLPPPAPDPAKDPTNIASREMLHAHVLQSMRSAQARLGKLCPGCRKEWARP